MRTGNLPSRGLLPGCLLLLAMLLAIPSIAQDLARIQVELSFKGTACQGMPIWAYLQFPKTYQAPLGDLRYPFSTTPWNFQGYDAFQVMYNGRPVAARAIPNSHISSRWYDSRDIPNTFITGRVPLHLLFRFDNPGRYQVRFARITDERMPRWSDAPEPVSEWVTLEVKPISEGDRQAWQQQLLQDPTQDAGKLVGDILPSLLAQPDETVLPLFLRCLSHENQFVRDYVMASLAYFPDDLVRREIPRHIAERGLQPNFARYLQWHFSSLQPAPGPLIEALIPYLHSTKPVETYEASRALFLIRYGEYPPWGITPEQAARIDAAMWKLVPEMLRLQRGMAFYNLLGYLEHENSARSRDMLWRLITADGKDALYDKWQVEVIHTLCRLPDQRDLDRLGTLLVQKVSNLDPAFSSMARRQIGILLAEVFHDKYGDGALSYIQEGMAKASTVRTRLECAETLAGHNLVEGYLFFEDALKRYPEEQGKILSMLRGHLEIKATDEKAVLKVLNEKIHDLQTERRDK
ncbi:MAG: hypothetical protein ACYDCO_18960 [Armatimonadota bacterium]